MNKLAQTEIDACVRLAIAAYGAENGYTLVQDFVPHRWVVEAMQLAYKYGYDDGYVEGEIGESD